MEYYISTTGAERREYAEWKCERDKIDKTRSTENVYSGRRNQTASGNENGMQQKQQMSSELIFVIQIYRAAPTLGEQCLLLALHFLQLLVNGVSCCKLDMLLKE